MSEFKSQAEVWQALLDGKTIVSPAFKYHIHKATVFYSNIDRDVWDISYNVFHDYAKYSTYTEPKPKKIVRMAPALWCCDNSYYITSEQFSSEKEARDFCCESEFVKWLIDTHGVDVEVDDE
jgi:hypothetical protein